MSRFMKGTKPSHSPVDYDRIIAKRLGKLGFPRNSRAMQCAEELVRRTITESSAISYAQESAFWLRWCRDRGLDPLKVTPEDVGHFRAANAGYAMGTQHLKLLVVRLLFKIAIRRGWVRENPVVIPHSIRRIPESMTPALSREQCDMFLGAIAAETGSADVGLTALRDLALATTMIGLCLRTAEAAELRWGRLHRSAGMMQISFVGKGRKPAHLPVPDDVMQLLTSWRRAFERATGTKLGPADPIFVGVSTREIKAARERGSGRSPLPTMTRTCIYRIINERLRDVGLEGARYGGHCLRATGAVLSIEGGSTLIEVQELLRHASIDTTMRYLQRLTLGAMKRAVDNIRLTIPRWDDDSDDDAGAPVAA